MESGLVKVFVLLGDRPAKHMGVMSLYNGAVVTRAFLNASVLQCADWMLVLVTLIS